jgi:hypothetical protein
VISGALNRGTGSPSTIRLSVDVFSVMTIPRERGAPKTK